MVDLRLQHARPTASIEYVRPYDWRDDALCAQVDPEIFHPEKGGSTREAKSICMRCDVRQECLDDALATGERYGVRGGLSERERRGLTRTTRITECGTPAGAKRHYRNGEKPCEPCREASLVARRERQRKGRAA